MRVLLVGVGGAGCRIVNSIYDNGINSPIRCAEGIVVDRDAEALNSLPSLPRDQRIFYQPLDPNHTAASLPSDLIVTKLQNLNPGDIDAIIVCAGLGGRLALGIQPLVRRVRESMFEPVFGLFTLPCEKEGDDILGLAADGFDSLLPEMDGIILFDNDLFMVVCSPENSPKEPPDEGIGREARAGCGGAVVESHHLVVPLEVVLSVDSDGHYHRTAKAGRNTFIQGAAPGCRVCGDRLTPR